MRSKLGKLRSFKIIFLFLIILIPCSIYAENIFHISYLYYTDDQISQEEFLTSFTDIGVLGRKSESSGYAVRLDYDFLTYFTGSLKYMHREFHIQTEDPNWLNFYVRDLKTKGYSNIERDKIKIPIPRTSPLQYKYYYPIQYHKKRGDVYFAGLTARTAFFTTFKFSFQYSRGISSANSADQSAANDRLYESIESAVKAGTITDVDSEKDASSRSYNGSVSQAFFNGNTELELGISYVDSCPVFPLLKEFDKDLGTYYAFDRTSAYQFGTSFILSQVLTKTTAIQLIGVYATDPDLEDGREISFRINQYIPPTRSSIHFTHRYFSDTFSLRSNLLEFLFYQYITDSTILRLKYRYYWEDNDAFDYDTLVTNLDPDDFSVSESISPVEGRLYGAKLTQNLVAFFSEDSQIASALENVALEFSYHRMTIYDKRYDKYIDNGNIGYGDIIKNEGETKIESDIFYMGLTVKF